MTDLWQPPHSIDAERAVLGAMLLDNRAFDAVAETVTEADFYASHHREIWRETVGLIERGKAADAVTVCAALRERRSDVERDYVEDLQLGTATAYNARRYAEIVRERSILRRLAAAAVSIGDLAHNGLGRTSAELLQEAEALLAGLTDHVQSEDAAPIGEYLPKVVDEIEARMNRGGDIQGLSTGLRVLDDKTNGLQAGDLIVVAGRTSMGKTALSMQIAQHVALESKTVLVFSLEMPRQQLIERMLANLGRVNSHALRNGRLNDDDWSGISSAMGRLLDSKLLIDDTSPLNVTQLRARARRAKRKHGLDLIVIDYIGLMDGDGERRHEQVADISRRLKTLAKEMSVPVLALAQLNRKSEDRTNNRPRISDLRDSGAVEQDADLVLLLYRDDYYNEDSEWKGTAEIIVAKQRMGETGTIRTLFVGENSRFADLPDDFISPAAAMGQKRRRKGME